MRRIFVFLLAAAVALSVGPTKLHAGDGQHGEPHGGVVASGYDYDAQTVGLRLTLSSGDTLTKAAILATPELRVFGKTTIPISARFSNSAATCKIRLAYVYKADPNGSSSSTTNNYIKGYSQEITLTAGSTQYEGSYYPAPDVLFDTEGATAVRVLITQATSAGTVDLWPGSY